MSEMPLYFYNGGIHFLFNKTAFLLPFYFHNEAHSLTIYIL